MQHEWTILTFPKFDADCFGIPISTRLIGVRNVVLLLNGSSNGATILKSRDQSILWESVVLQIADEMKIKMPVSYTGITVKSHLEDN